MIEKFILDGATDWDALRVMRDQQITDEYFSAVSPELIALRWDMTISRIRQIVAVYANGRRKNDGRVNRWSPKAIDLSVAQVNEARIARQVAICEMYNTGLTLESVGAAYGITRERVRQILEKNGHTLRHGGVNEKVHVKARIAALAKIEERNRRKAEMEAKEQQVLELYRAGKTYIEICVESGIPWTGTIIKILTKHKAMNRRGTHGWSNHRLHPDQKLEMAKRYSQGENTWDLSEEYGCHPQYVSQVSNKLGFHRQWENGELLRPEVTKKAG